MRYHLFPNLFEKSIKIKKRKIPLYDRMLATVVHCILLLFQPDSESFGKMQKIFDMTTLMPAKSVPKFYYIRHLCQMEHNRKFNFCQFFQKQNRILLFEYLAYIKNVIFWATSSWCSSKIEYLEGGSKAAIVAYKRPSHSIKFWATSTWCTSKDHIFNVGEVFKQQNFILFLKKLKKIEFSVLLYFT